VLVSFVADLSALRKLVTASELMDAIEKYHILRFAGDYPLPLDLNLDATSVG